MKHNDGSRGGDHKMIMPTARMVAYCRSFSDIPYAKEISDIVLGEIAAREIFLDDFHAVTKIISPFLEARYKCFDRFICEYKNILELAVGTSAERGISISEDPKNVYVGTDLPEMINETRTLFKALVENGRPNHHLKAANVLSFDELSDAVDRIRGRGDVAIINEGILPYLTIDEQAICADNIRRILVDQGGVWITPDLEDLHLMQELLTSLEPVFRLPLIRAAQRIVSVTGRDEKANRFKDSGSMRSFFEKLGFTVRQYSIMDEGTHLKSLRVLWCDSEDVFLSLLKRQYVWVLSPG